MANQEYEPFTGKLDAAPQFEPFDGTLDGEKPKDASALRKVGDLGLSVSKGVVAVPEALVGLADIPTGGRVGKFLENEGGAFGFRPKQAKEYLGGLQSDDLRDKQQQFQKADGIIDKAGAALSNPSLITNAVAESVPLMGAGAVPARAALAVAPKLGAVAAGAVGEGVVGAGSAAEGIRQETADGLMTAGQSGLALASGAATSAFGFAGGKLAQRLGIGDVDTMLTQGAIKSASAPSAKSIPRQMVEGAIAEGWLEELPQSVSEQVLQNLALDKPWHEGVDDAAVMGTLAGMAMGGAAAGASGFAQDTPPADAQQPQAAPPATPQPQAGPTLALPAPDPGVIAVDSDGTARTPAYQKPSFAGEYADVTDVVPRALAPQPADPVRAAVESAANAGGALSPAALVAIDSGVTPRQEGAFEDAPELDAQPPQVNLDEITDPYDRAYYESLFDDDPAPLGAPPVLSAFLQNDDDIPDFDAANNVSEEDFLRALGADDLEIQDAIATTPNRAESAPEGAALPAGPQANVTAGTPEGAGAGAEQPAGPVADAPTNLRDALAKVRAQKQEAANAQAAQAPAPAAAPAPGPTGAAAVEAAGVAPQASIQAITAKQIPDMTDAELQAAIVHYGPAHKRTAKLQKEAQRRAALPPQSQPNGALNVPQADQAQQAAAQPAQAGPAQPAQGLTDGAPAENHGAQGTPAPGAQGAATSEPEFTTLKTTYGDSVTVRTADLNSDKPRLRQYTKDGKSKAVPAIARDNLDPTGGKRAEQAKANADNPIFQVVTTRNGAAFGSAAAAQREVNRLGFSESHEVVPVDGGFVGRKKQAQALDGKAQVATNSEANQSEKERWLKSVADMNRMSGQFGAQIDGVTNGRLSVVGNPNATKQGRALMAAVDEARRADATNEEIAQAAAGRSTAAPVAAELSLDEQLKQVNDELANQGPVQNANTRTQRDQIRKAIAERDFPEILKAVDGDVGSAEAINQALQFAGDEPKAKVIERVLKNRGITAEYRQRWAERLMDGQVDELDAEMQSYESKADVERKPNLKTGPSSANTPVAPPAPVPSGIPSAQARWDVFMSAERREMLRAAGYTDADQARALSGLKWVELSESVRKAVDSAYKQQVSAAAPAPSPGVVNVPPAIAAALDADMQAQKARITRLRNAATAEGMSLEEKKQAQTQLKGAEFNLQTMRRTRFDAEDAALKVIEQKDMAPFAEHITFFKTEKALQELIGAAAQERNPDGRPKTPADKAMERIAAEDAADRDAASQPPAEKPKKKPSADQTRAKADLMNALADLGDILGKNTRMNIMPEQEQKLLPVLTRVLDAAFRLGYHKFKDSAKFALDQIRAHLGDEAADALTLQHLQGAYVAMSGSYLSSGAESIGDVAAIRSLSELLGSTDAGVKAGAGEVQSDSFVADTELAANSRAGQPGRVQVDSEAQVEALRSVDGLMLRIGQDRKVLDAVVRFVPADVVDVLRGQELTPEMLFNDPSVLIDLAGFGGNAPVASRINAARSVVEAAARFAAESPAPSELGWAASDFDAALDAIERRHSAIVSGDVAGGAKKVTKPDAKTLTESLYQAIGAGNMPKDNPALKKLVEAFDGQPADQARMKQAQEELETAIAMSARDIVAKGESDKATFDALLRLYESQPNLNIRTSTSVANQAYSTPAPLAFLASRLAGITRSTVAHEPTGGTGMLLIGADPKKALVNELNDLRISALKAQGFSPTQKDAATMLLVPEGTKSDAVVTNPPFGSVKDADGKPVKVKVDGFSIGQIDHLIAARALQTMKDDGKATLILGANKIAGGLSTDDRIFFNWLYSHYNVAGHFEVDGDLYARQGAGWPVRVITINGRQKSGKLAPVAGTIQRADNWSQVYEQFTQSISSASQSAAAKPADGTGERAPVSAAAPAAPGGSRPQGSTGSAGNVAGARPRVVPDSAKPAAEPVGPVPDEQRLNAESFVPQPQPGQEPAGAQRPSKPAGTTAVADAPAAAGNEFQSPYVPRSARKDDGVLIPSNMAQPTQDALNRLEDSVGDIDEFARSELGYATVADLHNALMGLQVDSVATAIYQIKQNKAVVIADQTGIGKGRQAASIIRWAARNGMTPVFVSVKPSLFTDMYGDLADIGTSDVAPFILNSSEWVSGTDGEKLFANKPSTHRAAIQSIVDNAALPQGRNALFMTYSQINTANLQRQALMALAPNAVFVLDESHNAAGDSGTGEFMISVLKEARGVTYLSATYAKRPDNMPLYFKTDIGDAAADSEGLADAMAAGGLPLQTVVSNNLVKAGQMFRRERSYDGVSIASTFDTANRQLHERLSDEATEALRAIVSADKLFHSVFVKSMDKALKAEGSQVQDNAGNQVSAGVQHTEFSSVVHNFVRQMLLGLKAQTAADEAIASLKLGEKPIIAVENTMGSFLSEYAAQNNINQGDSLGAFDYRTVLSRALERSRVINVVLPNGDKSKKNIALSELDPITRKAYDQAQAVIDRLAIDIPVSPIDWMRAEIARAGFSVAEITGRDLSVDYSNPRKPVLSAIDLTEQRDKVASTRRFNGGELDALILNVAGSTGISLHASEKFADQRQRHMIVAQAAGDINIFMQMLGRVHRTGQVRLPKYTILSVDLPTEKRPTAVLSRKMKSLNANTSSNTESATSVKTSDILNKYGDQIVNQYLVDNLELARQLGVDDLLSSDGERVSDDIARKATGRLALQPIEVQRAFYEDVEAQYDALIEYLNKTNQNDLEPRTFDFDAKEVRTEILFDGPNKTTPFGEDAVYGEYSIKAQGVAMKPEEIQAAIAESLQGKAGAEHARDLLNGLLQTYVEQTNAALAQKVGQGAAFDLDQYAAFLKPLFGEDGAARMMAQAQAFIANGTPVGQLTARDLSGAQGVEAGMEFLRNHAIGKTFRVEINSEPYNAVITNVRNTHKTTGNPFSLSKFQITMAVNGALRSITVPATQFKKIEVSSIAPAFRIETLFKEQPANQRETAKIVTGNLLAAYGEIKGARGTIISFTKADGVIEQGILLPKLFDFSKNTQGDYRLRSGADALKFLQQSTNKDIGRFGIATRDGQVRVLPRGDGVQVRVPKSKAQGARYFLDKNLIAVAGDFVSSANAMMANVDDAASAAKVLDLLMDKQALYALPSMADEAKSMAAKKDAGSGKADGPEAIYSSADSTLPAKPLTLDRVNQLVQEALSGIRGAPPVEVTARPGDIGLRVPAGSVGYGVTLRSGDIYVFQSAMGSDLDVFKTVFHELFHRGVRVLVPKAQYVQTMLDLAKGDSRIQQLAIEWKNTEMGQKQKDNLREQGYTGAELTGQYEALAIEEALAAVAEEIKAQGKLGSKPKSMTIRFLANWLAKVADMAGMKKLAHGIRTMTYNEAERFVMSAIDRSGEPVQAGRTDNLSAKRAERTGDQTQTEAFKRWFAGSRVVDADGKPLVVYHGSSRDIESFAAGADEAGQSNGNRTGAWGSYFTPSAAEASIYAEIAGGDSPQNVVPVYLAIRNPYVMNRAEWGKHSQRTAKAATSAEGRADAKAVRAGIEALGHDGIVIRDRGFNDEWVAFRPEQIKSSIGNSGAFDPADPDIRFRSADMGSLKDSVGDAVKSVTVQSIKDAASYKKADWLGLGLQALGRRQIVDIYGDMLPLAEYNTLVQQMEADKNEGGAEADQLVTRWAKLDDEAKLADLMHEATLAQIDPAKPYVGGDDKAKYAMLAGRFNALSQEAKQVYTDTRDAYQAHHAKVRSAIKERIERSELKGPRKAELLKQMDDEFFAAVKGVYFPLARFGQYAVTVKGADGKVESVSRAETKAEAEALRNNLLSAFPRDKGFTVGRVMLSKDFIADRDAVGRGFMTELYQVLDKQDMDAAQRAELEDTLGQLYLSSLPDLSWAKHGIHRKGTPGFSQDARRAYAQNMFHGSRYLAKLRYSDLMQDELTAMQKHVDDWREVEDFDQNSAQRVVDEMNKRHESLMNPKSNPLSTALTSLGFVFHLGLSPASAMVNLSQTALVAYPIMGAKWGFGKASAALLKASTEAAKGKNDITASLNADERAAYDEAVRAGTIDVTMAHDLAGIAQGEDAGVMWKMRPVMRWASFLFHHAERFNRQVTFVAAYRLAREAGTDHKAAFEQATKATYDGHFDYNAANRPRIMQGNVAKVLLLFKQYGQNMVYTLARSAQQSFKGETPEARAQARKALGGLLATHAAAAGVLGLPLVNTLLAAASMLGGDDDEPWDAKVALQNMLADTFGQKPAEVLAHGLSRLTPWDISGRVGLDRLIFPDLQEGLEGQRLAESAMVAALGPVAGIGVNVLKGAQHMGEGRYALGLEAMLPSALRGSVKAIRYANEGVQDKSGISILDEVSPAAVAGQALGFSPSQARNAQEGKSAVMAHDRALGERRQSLLTKAARATMDKDTEARAEAMKEIERFNQKNPTRRITPLNVLQSVRNRNKRIDQAQDGVYLPKSRRDAMEAGRFALSD